MWLYVLKYVFSFLEETYNCSPKSTCSWADYTENIDWGYYSSTNGDCVSCKARAGTTQIAEELNVMVDIVVGGKIERAVRMG